MGKAKPLTAGQTFKQAVIYTGYFPLLAVVYLLSLLPFSVLYVLSRWVYVLTYKVFKYRYDVVLQNLSRSFPAMSYKEVNSIAKQFYRHFSKMLAEMLKLLTITEKELKKRVELVNPGLLKYYQQQNRSVIAVLGHYGNWEYLNILPKYVEFEVNAIYKPLSSGVFDLLIRRLRSRFGLRMLPVHQAVRYMLQNRHKPALYLFIADQSPAPEARTRINFMHQGTLMFNGVEKLARATNAVVVYMELIPAGERYWKVKFSVVEEQPMESLPDGIVRGFAERLEETIHKAPPYWLWTHKRWKHASIPQFS